MREGRHRFKPLRKEDEIMATAEKEYLVGTVRPTNRPEAGQELDLDTLILFY